MVWRTDETIYKPKCKMINSEIKYELLECLVVVRYMKEKLSEFDLVAVELTEQRLLKLINHFVALHKKEIADIDEQLKQALKG